MRPMIVMVLLLTTGALGQGAYRPTPPTIPPAPVGPHTVGQPGHVRTAPELERSPHKRVLPATREPGLWAGDRPKATKDPEDLTPVTLLGIVLPFVPDADDLSRSYTRTCGEQMDYALARGNVEPRAQALSIIPRRCLAARLYQHCANGVVENYKTKAAAGETLDREFLARVLALKATADKFEKTSCVDKDAIASSDGLFQPTALLWAQIVKGPPDYGF
jgi:hypothetical protein